MRRSLLVRWRNAHEPGNFEAVDFAAARYKCVGLLRQDPRLLRLGAGIDLNKELWMAGGSLDLAGKRYRNLLAVDRLDHVEKAGGLARLIRLQRSYEMKFDIWISFSKLRPFGQRFLDPVFAKDALTRLDHRPYLFRSKSFGDADEGYRLRQPAGIARRKRNARTHQSEAIETCLRRFLASLQCFRPFE